MATGMRQISVTLTERDVERLDALAALRGEDRSETVRFLLQDSDHDDVLGGLAELDRGEGVPIEDVMSKAKAIIGKSAPRKRSGV